MDNDQQGADINGAKCGRWNPTNEQVEVLMDLFRAGLRTPTADQIQKISSHLSAFGKIESKNVFYWFQNHKARERHHVIKKRRRGNGGDHFVGAHPCVLNPARKEARCDEARVTWEYVEGRDVETLELFPLRSHYSCHESPENREITSDFGWNDDEYCTSQISFHSNNDDSLELEPQLDLRLSFL